MKPIIFPLIALVAAGTWHYVNANKIAALRESLDQPPSSEPVAPSTPVNEEKAFIAPEGIELDRIERYFDQIAKGEIKSNGNNARLWIEQKFNLMSGDDLLAFLDDLEHSDFPSNESKKMVSQIHNALINRHPQKYLQRFGIQGGGYNNPSERAFYQLMKQDMTAAITWFDDYLKETKLEETESSIHLNARVQFEQVIARALYPDNIPALNKRLQNLRLDQVSAIVNSVGMASFKDAPQQYLDFIRSNLPELGAANLIGNTLIYATHDKGPVEAANAIKEYQLTKGEKAAFFRSKLMQSAWDNGGNPAPLEIFLPLLKEQGIETRDEIYASGVARIYSNQLCGKGDLTKVYSYVQDVGQREDLENLFPKFVAKTTSRICECCSLQSRLERISNEELKSAIANSYQENLSQSK